MEREPEAPWHREIVEFYAFRDEAREPKGLERLQVHETRVPEAES